MNFNKIKFSLSSVIVLVLLFSFGSFWARDTLTNFGDSDHGAVVASSTSLGYMDVVDSWETFSPLPSAISWQGQNGASVILTKVAVDRFPLSSTVSLYLNVRIGDGEFCPSFLADTMKVVVDELGTSFRPSSFSPEEVKSCIGSRLVQSNQEVIIAYSIPSVTSSSKSPEDQPLAVIVSDQNGVQQTFFILTLMPDKTIKVSPESAKEVSYTPPPAPASSSVPKVLPSPPPIVLSPGTSVPVQQLEYDAEQGDVAFGQTLGDLPPDALPTGLDFYVSVSGKLKAFIGWDCNYTILNRLPSVSSTCSGWATITPSVSPLPKHIDTVVFTTSTIGNFQGTAYDGKNVLLYLRDSAGYRVTTRGSNNSNAYASGFFCLQFYNCDPAKYRQDFPEWSINDMYFVLRTKSSLSPILID